MMSPQQKGPRARDVLCHPETGHYLKVSLKTPPEALATYLHHGYKYIGDLEAKAQLRLLKKLGAPEGTAATAPAIIALIWGDD
jgi:hypothetical protein